MLREIVQSKAFCVQPECNSGEHGSGDRVFSRVLLKLALLAGHVNWHALETRGSRASVVVLSQCDECGALVLRVAGCERGLRAIEEKLDRLIELQVGRDGMPAWAQQSEKRVVSAVREITAEVGVLASANGKLRAEADRLRVEIGDLAEGADRFLAGLQSQLRERDKILFFELISSVACPEGRRVKTYAEIGKMLGGVRKQAIQKRVKKLFEQQKGLADYVRAIREPKKLQNFSEMSPSARRKHGIDTSYNYDAG